MYEVKKNDYNTVRFLPDSNTGYRNDFQQHKKKKRTRRKIVLILVILLIIAAAAFSVYRYIFSPSEMYLRAFEESDFATCEEIFAENAYDTDFVSDIKPTVISSSSDAYDRYIAGKLSYTEASELIQQNDSASGGEFSEDLAQYTNGILAIEEIRGTLAQFQADCADGKYDTALSTAMTLSSEAAAYNIDYSAEISGAIIDNFHYFKAAAFRAISAALNSKEFDRADSICTFLQGITTDDDVNAQVEVNRKAREGELSIRRAVRQTNQVARDAQKQAEKTSPSPDGDSQVGGTEA